MYAHFKFHQKWGRGYACTWRKFVVRKKRKKKKKKTKGENEHLEAPTEKGQC